jgi:hypothetical protein
MVKKQIAFSLGSQPNARSSFLMEVDDKELQTKIDQLKKGESKDGATVSDFNMYKARPSNNEQGYEYALCPDEEVFQLFGTVSADSIVEWFFEHSNMKSQV